MFFTSDTHFGHANILKYCARPFANIAEHDNALIARWNMVVGPEDQVYHLGDFSFTPRERTEEILSQLNGRIHLVLGNHDYYKRRNKPGCDVPLSEWYPYTKNTTNVLDVVPGTRFELVHNPEHALRVTHTVLCGHVHEEWRSSWAVQDENNKTLLVNVGVDQWNYTPVHISELLAYIANEGAQ